MMMSMNLLAWYSRIPGHEQNVRVPSSFSRRAVIVREDTIPTVIPTQSILSTRTYNAYATLSNISIPITQGIDGPIALENIPQINKDDPGKPDWWYRVHHGSSEPSTYRSPIEADHDWEMAWQREEERREAAWTPGNWWSWGYTDETIPQAYTSGLW